MEKLNDSMAAWIKNNLLRPLNPDLVAVQPSASNGASQDAVRLTTANIKVGFIWRYMSLSIVHMYSSTRAPSYEVGIY